MTQNPQDTNPQRVADAPPVTNDWRAESANARAAYLAIMERAQVTFSAAKIGVQTDESGWQHTAYTVTLARVGNGPSKPYTTTYRMGMAHKSAPNAADVLDSMRSDAEYAGGTFQDFCENLGYDEDSRKALASYLECQTIGHELRRLFGRCYADLMATERL